MSLDLGLLVGGQSVLLSIDLEEVTNAFLDRALTEAPSKLNVMSEAPEVTMSSAEIAALRVWLRDRLFEYRELLAYLRDH